MPRVTLGDGRTAFVSVKKDTITLTRKKKEIVRRRVSAKIMILAPLKEGQEKADIAIELNGEVICSEKDYFSPKYGRQEAVRRLMKIVGERINREDRRTIYKTLCPEFFLSKNDRMRAEFNRLKNILYPVAKVEEQVA